MAAVNLVLSVGDISKTSAISYKARRHDRQLLETHIVAIGPPDTGECVSHTLSVAFLSTTMSM